MMQVLYPGEVANFSCRAEGFSMLNYNWFMIANDADTETEIVNEVNTTYTITDLMYEHNATGYYCTARNNEGIAVSTTSTLIGNNGVL